MVALNRGYGEGWQKVSFSSDCLYRVDTGDRDTCCICGGYYPDCPCPGPTQDEEYEYEYINGELYAKKK